MTWWLHAVPCQSRRGRCWHKLVKIQPPRVPKYVTCIAVKKQCMRSVSIEKRQIIDSLWTCLYRTSMDTPLIQRTSVPFHSLRFALSLQAGVRLGKYRLLEYWEDVTVCKAFKEWWCACALKKSALLVMYIDTESFSSVLFCFFGSWVLGFER